MLDLLLRNGRVVDGSGNVWFHADIGIKDGKIVHVGHIDALEAERTLDVKGLVVCPGFIDVHTHSEMALLANPKAETSLRMGATTHISGNCGMSAGPVDASTPHLLAFGMPMAWETLGEHLSVLEKSGTALNFATLVGHGNVRGLVMGKDFARPSKPEEVEAMKRLVAEAMEQGAVGMSSGLVFSPGRFAETSELLELCKVVSQHDGVYASHVRSQADYYPQAIAEAIEISEQSGAPAQLSHCGPMTPHWGRAAEFFAPVTAARERGVDMTIDIIGGLEGVGSLNDMFPPWTTAGGVPEQLKRFQDPVLRERIKRELLGEANWGRNNPALLVRAGRWDLFAVHEAKDKSLIGKTFAALAAEAHKDPLDYLMDYLIEEGESRGTLEVVMLEDDMRTLATLPYTMFSSDVWPTLPEGPLGALAAYPTQYGAFPWVFRRIVRDSHTLTLEQAVQRMTSLPAQRFGLWDRGLVREDMWADIVVLDPDTIADRGTWENPRQFPAGIEYVLVNGQVSIEQGRHTGVLAGKVLRHC